MLMCARVCGFCLQDDCDDCNCCEEGDSQRRRCYCCGMGGFLVFVLLFALSWDTLEPTEYGLVQNGFTGYVDLRPSSVYQGGRYFVWLVRHPTVTWNGASTHNTACVTAPPEPGRTHCLR